ncbi:MAG: alpha/beta hydrolase [Eubacteriaceae bacterium]|jgi:pimeloyl-ACP methyl ester carboxylesterase|nr:alpha/beta hydrolase [Eubacteriaceae bacterium]
MFININGINMFYRKAGSGRPVIMMHGNGQSSAVFDEAVEVLKDVCTVYTPDSRGHGQTSYLNDQEEAADEERRAREALAPEGAISRGELSYDVMADDMIAFIDALGIEKPVIYGFSDGGIIALIMTIKRPDIPCRLMVSGVNVEPEGIDDKYFRSIKVTHFLTRSKKKKLMLDQPHISAAELGTIKVPTVLLAGEHDLIKPEHLQYITDCIPTCRLKILKGEDHTSYVMHSTKIADMLREFMSL